MSKADKLYPIEEIVKERIRNGNVEYFVKWKGYSSKSNSWIPSSDIEALPKKEVDTKKSTTKSVRARQSKSKRISKASSRITKKTSTKSTSITSTAKRIIDSDFVTRTTQTTTSKRRPKGTTQPIKHEQLYEIERILGKRIVNSKVEYLVQWKGYSRDQSTWEPEGPLKSDYCKIYCHSLRKAFSD